VDTGTKFLIGLGIAAGVGLAAVAIMASRSTTAYAPAYAPQPGTLTLVSQDAPPAEAMPPVEGNSIENFSEITWTDSTGRERKLVSRRTIHW
jgi:hypothetical protein